jgi:N4-gp56 family major capsid protein
MDQQMGDILRRRRYQNLATAPVPLGNGIVDPAAQQLTALDIDARIDWYGTYLILQEQVMLINEDPKMNGVYKLTLIDMEARQGDMAQAKAA